MRRTAARWALLAVGAVLPLTLCIALVVEEWDVVVRGGRAERVGEAANLCALAALPLLVALVVLGARQRWVERVFGLDRMLRFHKRLAGVALVLVAAHALLKTLRVTLALGGGWRWSVLFSASLSPWALAVGRLALLLMVLGAGAGAAGALGLAFRAWKPAHLLLYPAVAAGLVHARFLGSDMREMPFEAVWWLLVVVFAGCVVERAAFVAGRKRRRTWRVARTVPETHDTTSLELARDAGPGALARRRAGQFAVIRVRRGRRWSEPHPFTISCAPSVERLRFTIKAVGPFSAAVPDLAAGTEVLCEGPYGIFCPELETERELVFIAGGVGITPFLSVLRDADQRRATNRFTLIWGNKTQRDIIARDELEAMSDRLDLRIVHVLSAEPPASSPPPAARERVDIEYGLVTAELLARRVRPERATFYLCGPPPMQRALLPVLRRLYGLRRGQVRRELFFW